MDINNLNPNDMSLQDDNVSKVGNYICEVNVKVENNEDIKVKTEAVDVNELEGENRISSEDAWTFQNESDKISSNESHETLDTNPVELESKEGIDRNNELEVDTKDGIDRNNDTEVQNGPTDPKRQFVCSVCNKAFLLKQHLTRHLREYHDIESVASKEEIEKKIELALHCASPDEKGQFDCSMCNKQFIWKENLTRHLRKAHGMDSVAAKKIEQKSSGSGKSGSSKGNSQLVCTFCKKEFSWRKNLIRHMRYVHSKVKPMCPGCRKFHESETNLKRHMETCVLNNMLQGKIQVSEVNYDQNADQNTSTGNNSDPSYYNGEDAEPSSVDDLSYQNDNPSSQNQNPYYEEDPNQDPSHQNQNPYYDEDPSSQNYNNDPSAFDDSAVVIDTPNHYNMFPNHFKSDNKGKKSKSTKKKKKKSVIGRIRNEEIDYLTGIKQDNMEVDNNAEILMDDVPEMNSHYGCPMCDSYFPVEIELIHHLETVHVQVRHVCPYCKEQYSLKSDLIDHVNSIHLMPVYECYFCNERFKSEQILSDHVHLLHFDELFICRNCQTQFPNMELLNSHNCPKKKKPKMKPLEKRFDCDQCDKKFAQRANLRVHMNSVHLKVKHECQECGKTFSSQVNLRHHMDYIHLNRKFPCPICRKEFAQKVTMKRHMQFKHKDEMGENIEMGENAPLLYVGTPC